MDSELFKRRQRMLRLLSVGNSLNAVVQTLSAEFHVSEWVIYKDHKRMKTWVHNFEQDEALSSILRARLDYLNREAMGLLTEGDSNKPLTAKDRFVKIGALNTALRITVEQIRLAQELGLVERKPEVIQSAISLNMPFEASPEIKAAYAKFAEAQRAEKDAATKAESDAGH
jgi:NADPH-dependent glutamate synthase beta subunit-like oxidoreductase